MLIWIISILILYFVQVVTAPTMRYTAGGRKTIWIAMGNRDKSPEMSPLAARFDRALKNLQEALFLFLPLALLAEMQGATPLAIQGATVFVMARIAYVPAYISGIPGLRSAVWGIGHGAIIVIGIAVIRSS